MVDPPDIHPQPLPRFYLANPDRHHRNNDNDTRHTKPRKPATWRLHAAFTVVTALVTCLLLLSFGPIVSTATVLPARNDAVVTQQQHNNNAPLPVVRENLDRSFVYSQDLFDASKYSDTARTDATELIRRLLALRQDDGEGMTTSRDGAARRLPRSITTPPSRRRMDTCSEEHLTEGQRIGYGIIVPVLVILSGIAAGLTIGYFSLDPTQLQVLSNTGTEKQKRCAQKILPIRKDGHLLLTTLLIANMITNETLPVVSEPLFPQKVLAVVVPTILIIIFAELVPQSVCSRYGLEIGAFMAFPVRLVMIVLWPVAYPVSRVLHWTLGPHHGIVYRRAELKELVTMHAAAGGRGGDLKGDTVMMVGGALDLQEKVAKEAMTPIDRVFMLPLDAKLDYPTLERVVRSGHSRIPIYQEIEVPISAKSGFNTPSKRGLPTLFNALTRRATSNSVKQPPGAGDSEQPTDASAPESLSPPPTADTTSTTIKRKKIVGTLLVKSCVLLDPEDAVPVSQMTINALPSVPNDEPLLNVLNAFQEGRSHMAIVTALSRSQSSIDPTAVKGIHGQQQKQQNVATSQAPRTDGLSDIDEERQLDTAGTISTSSTCSSTEGGSGGENGQHHRLRGFWKKHFGHDEGGENGDGTSRPSKTSSDATLAGGHDGNDEDELSPTARGDILGIITLEDVLEELIGEEIYDEYDPREDNAGAWNNVTPPASPQIVKLAQGGVGGNGGGVGGDALNDEKRALTAATAGVSLPPAALDVEDEHAREQTAVPSKTSLLGRLGLSGRKSNASVNPPPTPTSATAAAAAPTGDVADEKLALETIQGTPNTAVPTTATTTASHADEGPDYLNALAASEGARVTAADTNGAAATLHESPRPNAIPSHLSFFKKSQSRPASPAGGGGGAESVVEASSPTSTSASANANANAAAPASAPTLASPQPSRPLVVRKQRADGSTQNAIIGEHLLRGRRGGAAAGGASGDDLALALPGGGGSRSSTPTPKTSRFKSTPVPAPAAAQRGRSVGSETGAGAGGSTTPRRRSTLPPEGEGGGEDEQQEGGS